MEHHEDLFGPEGPLAKSIEGYSPRRAQIMMADAVSAALADGVNLAVEAGTGTGKTFAYLVPALLSGRRVIISTGTRTLQDQLFKRDLPTVAKVLGRPVRVALLKGRSNYLCLHRLELSQRQDRGSTDLRTVSKWALETASGDIAEVTQLPEQSPVWPAVTSTRDNCLGSECESYQQCHVVQARRGALDADIVVVNHHLLLADLAMKETGFVDLLPGADAVIVDEAHQIPDIAARFFGITLTMRQLVGLAEDAVAEALRSGSEGVQLRDCCDELVAALRDLRLTMGTGTGRLEWSDLVSAGASQMDRVASALEDLDTALAFFSQESPGIASCVRRVEELGLQLAHIRDDDPDTGIRWVERTRNGFALNLTPFDVADTLRGFFNDQDQVWIFTSATLAVADDFGHFMSRAGVVDANTLRLDSPFDFRNNATLYLPDDIPEPSHPDFTRCVVDSALPVLEASGGRAFFLFTSHRALRAAADYFFEIFDDNPPFPILVQGDAPRDDLLTRFRELGNAVLLGTGSFWEGVDVRGDALSVVIIDKLPFAAPDDPILRARIDAIKRNGQNPFMEHQLPQAVLALKQGVGRLIRDYDDRGLVMLCDRRVLGRSYGRMFLRSLPPMPITQSVDEARAFFNG